MTLKRLGWGVAVALVAAIALGALAVRLIDTPAVRAEIQSRLSSALGGQIEWEALEVRLLPAPHGELRRVRVEIPGVLSARADDVDVYLRLWPLLLRGRAEIASIAVSRPEVRIVAAGGQEAGGSPDALAMYRRAVEPAARALQRFAPQTEFRIEAASIDLPALPLQLRDLNATARTGAGGVDLQLDAASNWWQRLRVEGRVSYADLAARAGIELDGLAFDRDLPAAKVRASVSTDAKTAIEVDADVALGSLVREAKAKALLAAGKPPEIAVLLSGVDLAGAATIARRRLPGLETIESADGRFTANVRLSLGAQWQAHVDVSESDATVKIAQLPWKLSPHAGQVTVSAKEVRLAGLRGVLGDSSFSDVAARLELGKPLRLSAASGRATLKLEQWFGWLRPQVPQLEELSALSGSAEVELRRLALRFDQPARADYEALASLRAASVTLKALPAPIAIASGSVRADPSTLRLDKIAVAMLDARTLVSGTVATKDLKIELALADGVLGEKAMRWGLGRAEVPARLEPKTPIGFSAQRIAWAPGKALEADTRVVFGGGPQLGVTLSWQPRQLNLRRLSLKDAMSDASFSALVTEKQVQASFSGRLDARSIAAMLRQPLPVTAGSVRGEIRTTIDRDRPERFRDTGQLTIEALDLTWLAGRPLRIERAEWGSRGDDQRFTKASVVLEEQRLDVQAELRFTPQGPVVDARLESPGIVIDRLLPAEKPAAEKPAATPAADPPMLAKLWQVPLPGRVEMRAGFIQYKNYKIEPFEGTMVMDRSRADLQVKEARMCGVSFPLSAQATADSITLATQITMKDQPMAQAMHCLTGSALDITGTADLRADLRTQGKPAELLQNLSGTARGELRKGQIRQFALIGNILSVLSLRNLVSRDATLRGDGFPYRSLSAKGEFKNGEFLLEEGFLDSEAARIGASGRIDLQGADSRLDVLVGVLNTVDRVAGALPIIGDIFGNTMLALPIAVSGDIRDPRVVPLGPRAVTDRLLGIFERTLKLPGKLVPGPAPAKTD